MTTFSCLRAGALIDRRRCGLSDAEGLMLDEHLAMCPDCDARSRAVHRMVALVDVLDHPPLSGQAIERALARATASAAIFAPAAPLASERPLGRWALAGVAVLAIAGVTGAGVVTARGPMRVTGPAESAAPPAAKRENESAARLLAGDLLQDGRPVEAGRAVHSGALLSTVAGATLAVGHAIVELQAAAALAWDSASATALLRAGRAAFAVDSTPARRFRVATSRFVVEVMGTRFEVDLSGVKVVEGAVQVLSPDGEVLADRLPAGQVWTPEAARAAGAPFELRGLMERPAAPGARNHRSHRAVLDRLAVARAHLAEGDVVAARAEIAAALAGRVSRREEAEGRTMLAECAQAVGDLRDAVRRYLDVARRNPDLTAGEVALFAAARLEAGRGRSGAARDLLDEYLRLYPEGRFQREAAARLSALAETLP